MQTTRKAVRYYIDREADTPVIRSVPVSRPVTVRLPEADLARDGGQDATTFAAAESRRRDARHRLTSMVQASVRKYRHHAS
jgi:hypothetical protein